MIDVHVHLAPPRLPGVGSLNPVLDEPVVNRAAELRREMHQAGVENVLAMGCLPTAVDDPLGIAETLAVAAEVPGVHAIGIADPSRTEPEHVRRVETVLAAGLVRGFKAYLGYLHYGPTHPGYEPYYELAARFNVPFFFHTGDTYSPRAKLRYAQPLAVDDVAVDHPNVRFILAHAGNPWLMDAAEVVYKNVNVWADLSGLIVGDVAVFQSPDRRDALLDLAAAVRQAFRYAERPNRFLYGSDWPLVPMAAYRDFIRSLIPDVYHSQVFEQNARALFRL